MKAVILLGRIVTFLQREQLSSWRSADETDSHVVAQARLLRLPGL